eukprot:g55090.t1
MKKIFTVLIIYDEPINKASEYLHIFHLGWVRCWVKAVLGPHRSVKAALHSVKAALGRSVKAAARPSPLCQGSG